MFDIPSAFRYLDSLRQTDAPSYHLYIENNHATDAQFAEKEDREPSSHLLQNKMALAVSVVGGVLLLFILSTMTRPPPTELSIGYIRHAETIPSIKSAINQVYHEASNSPQFLLKLLPSITSDLELTDSLPPSTRSKHRDKEAARPMNTVRETVQAASAFENQPEPRNLRQNSSHSRSIMFNRVIAHGEDDDDDPVKAVVGEPLMLILKGNPSTGYSWTVDAEASSSSLVLGSIEPLRAVDSAADPGAIVGAPKAFSLKVVPTEEGQQSLTLRYIRPWDPKDDPTTRIVHLVTAACSYELETRNSKFLSF